MYCTDEEEEEEEEEGGGEPRMRKYRYDPPYDKGATGKGNRGGGGGGGGAVDRERYDDDTRAAVDAADAARAAWDEADREVRDLEDKVDALDKTLQQVSEEARREERRGVGKFFQFRISLWFRIRGNLIVFVPIVVVGRALSGLCGNFWRS